MIVTLIQNVALLIALVVVYQLIFHKLVRFSTLSSLISGFLFGAVAIASMMTPFPFEEGVVLDGRSIILSVAGFFGGPVVAAISAVLASLYRLHLGGMGSVVGIAVIFASAGIGVVYYYLRHRDELDVSTSRLWIFGLLVHGTMIALLRLVPEVGPALVRETWLHILLLFPVATVVVCRIFLEREKQYVFERERQRLEEELRQAQKMEAIGRLAGGVAHDFNNMLSVINGYTELALKMEHGNPLLREYLTAINQAGKKSAELTHQLLTFARKQPIDPKVMPLNETLSERISMLKRLVKEDIRIQWNPGERVGSVRIDPSQMDQILINLVVNARDSIESRGTISISTSTTHVGEAPEDPPPVKEMKPGAYAVLSIGDDGAGMDEETREHLFEPFYSTKKSTGSTGLGLATIYGILSQNDGAIAVDSAPGKGAEFRIYLPLVSGGDEMGESPEAADPPASSGDGTETILLVEDEDSVLKLSSIVLGELGYKVIMAGGPEEALQLSQSHEGHIDLLITDVIMPKMNGYDLWQKLNEQKPVRCLFISGYTADIIHRQGKLIGDIHFLQKPFSSDALTDKVREALASPIPESKTSGNFTAKNSGYSGRRD